MAKEIDNLNDKLPGGENLMGDDDINNMLENVGEKKDHNNQKEASPANGDKGKNMVKNTVSTGPKQKVNISVDKALFDEITMIFKIGGETEKPEVIFGTWIDGKMTEVKDKVAAQIKRTTLV